MVGLVVCSTGIAADERAALRAACTVIGAEYSGDLTNQTTHLVVPSHALPRSAKLACARQRGLQIVLPSWIHESAAHGSAVPLTAAHILPLDSPLGVQVSDASSFQMCAGGSGSGSGDARAAAAGTGGVVRSVETEIRGDVLQLIRAAFAQGELTHLLARRAEAAENGTSAEPWPASLRLGGDVYTIDAKTAWRKHYGQTKEIGAAHRELGSLGGVYTLREILFCLECRRLSHTDYFLRCVRAIPHVSPVLVNDKNLMCEMFGKAREVPVEAPLPPPAESIGNISSEPYNYKRAPSGNCALLISQLQEAARRHDAMVGKMAQLSGQLQTEWQQRPLCIASS